MPDHDVRDASSLDDTPTGNGSGGVTARGLGKQFGDLWALRDLDLDVAPGTILGLLGHNGAGKTTAIRILTTLTAPTTGSATVAGYDVVRDADAVRASIGVASQQATVDGLLSARKNLVMVGRLYHLTPKAAKQRADDLLEALDLADAADRLVKTFSGGMRRRLDLAASLIVAPAVLFLDEPTTGLDPRSRGDLWDMLRILVRNGTTAVLTTQYLDEADQLADDIAVLDHGRTVAHGTPADLKSRVGTDRVDVTVSSASDLAMVARATERFAASPATLDDASCVATVPIVEGTRLVDVMRALDAEGVDPVDLNRRQASLDDVFLILTGHRPAPDEPTDGSSVGEHHAEDSRHAEESQEVSR